MEKKDIKSKKKNDEQNKIETNPKLVERQKEKKMVKKIVWSIVTILVTLMIIFGIASYQYVTSSLQPLDATSEEEIQIEIPSGSSSADISRILEKNKVIKSASVFRFYIKLNNKTDFQAGYFLFSPSMTLEEIIQSLQSGGSPIAFDGTKILVQEGLTIEQVAESVAKSTDYSSSDFIKKVKNTKFLMELKQTYPKLLTSATEAKGTKYVLEGYLFPATYDFSADMSLETVIENMVKKTDEVMQEYYATIQEKKMTVQQVITLASLIEREGNSYEDRTKIASVFFNRIEAEMPLQSDISVLYALNKHKEIVTYKDLETVSPYNLYQNKGYGPGPFNNPSEDAIKATLNPSDTSYLYFLADTSMGKVYFSRTYAEHQELVEEYITP
ncbi:endolytic transglycosylase MltG [Carnobacterium funditum]|uniref:endolytic transglycosylase MltG n=1 Tax=Carnobacterium funditum TaxID=2752 RepID=UPI000B05C6C9|nr:endolytic transglycosylase MltG [Carnobacterium funditum]